MILDIIAANGVPFRVRYLPTGAAYGRDDALTNSGAPLVEFFDLRYPFEEVSGARGQFTGGRYYADTLLTRQAGDPLCLDGGNARYWTVDAAAMTVVQKWLRLAVRRDRNSITYAEQQARFIAAQD